MPFSITGLPHHALILHHPLYPPSPTLSPTPEVSHRVHCGAKKGMILNMTSKPKKKIDKTMIDKDKCFCSCVLFTNFGKVMLYR